VIPLLLAAGALGLSNLAASIAIGVSGVSGATRVRVAVVFGLFEAGMPVAGLAVGRTVSAAAGGRSARWIAGGLLAAVGCYELLAWLRGRAAAGRDAAPALGGAAGDGAASGVNGAAGRRWSGWRLIVTGLVLSIDNLIVGFALGAYDVGIVTAAVVIGLVSVAMSLAGLELGARLGAALGERAELAGGLVLVLVGALVAAGAF
jgi:manganese efflux pump family protein